MIAWVIRLFTELAQSDAAFWVRLPAPLFHMITALILGVLAKYLFGARTSFWVMVSYITVPAVGLGSWVISTDTIMAPFMRWRCCSTSACWRRAKLAMQCWQALRPASL